MPSGSREKRETVRVRHDAGPDASAMLVSLLERASDWLSPSDPLQRAGAAFALVRRESCKRFALELFRSAQAPTLLEVANQTPPPLRHYPVSFEGGNTHVEANVWAPSAKFGPWQGG